MEKLKQYLCSISTISENTLNEVIKLFEPRTLVAKDFFVKENEYAKKIAFLESGLIRAFFTNKQGKEYNKQLFVGQCLIGAYSSLLKQEKNLIPQQALADCKIWEADYSKIKKLFDKFHDFERLGRKIAEFYFLEKEQKELEMALLDATERYLLLKKNYPNIEQDIQQYHIASYLGISPTQLSRLKNKLLKK
jgi:CRP-like cAMP-binding protein